MAPGAAWRSRARRLAPASTSTSSTRSAGKSRSATAWSTARRRRGRPSWRITTDTISALGSSCLHVMGRVEGVDLPLAAEGHHAAVGLLGLARLDVEAERAVAEVERGGGWRSR